MSSSSALLRDARTAALRADRPVAVRFDTAARRLSAGAGALAIPPDIGFSLVVGGNCPAGAGTVELVFRPDGSSCGGVLRFDRGGRVVRARVYGTDGHIDVIAGG